MKLKWDTHLQTKETKREKHVMKCETQGHVRVLFQLASISLYFFSWLVE
jgi:hypothetical protein